MNNNLTSTNQNAKLTLSKSKKLLNITNSLLANKKKDELIDDDWMNKLWKWAIENRIPDPDDEKGRWFDDKGEKWGKGIPREKTRLLKLLELDLSCAMFNGNSIRELPFEITYLEHIKIFSIHNQNFLSKLPDKISNLRNLEKLNLACCESLVLTEEQKDWINKLKNNGCIIYIDDDLFSRSTQTIDFEVENKNKIPEIDIDEDEIPF